MVSQALTGTAPEPRPATPPVWGSACQITNCDRRRWTLSRSIMSSCKLEIQAKNSFSLIYPFPLSFLSYFISISKFSLISFHFLSFLFISFHSNRLPLCQRARFQFNSIQSPFRAFYLSTDYTNYSSCVATVHCRILNEGPLPRGDVCPSTRASLRPHLTDRGRSETS